MRRFVTLTHVALMMMVGCTRGERAAARTEAEPGRASSEPSPARDPTGSDPAPAQPTGVEVEAGETGEPEAPPSPEPAQPDPGSVRFWIADDGLAAYDLDGKQRAKLSEAPIDHARRLGDGRIVGLDDDADPLSLIVLTPDGAVERRVAITDSLDPQTCKFGSVAQDLDFQPDPLRIQSALDFKLAPGTACLGLQDRNDNMADYRVEVTVDLVTGGVAGTMVLDVHDVCEGQGFATGTLKAGCTRDSASLGKPWIEHAPATSPSKTALAYDFDEETLALVKRGKPQAVLCEAGAKPEPYSPLCAGLESRSPSGRWALLSGLWSEGDYIHRELVLLDRSTGVLLQVDHRYKQPTRFVEIPPEQLFLSSGDVSPLSMVGESDVGWLPDDRLWIDGHLLIPERREVVVIGGTRAYTL